MNQEKHQANAILGLLTETSLHAGAGSSIAGIDLPIQREGHNGWPCVFGSAVKGALRTKAEMLLGADNESVKIIFGPDTDGASEHAGALAVGDARLLLLPVRSLTSHFKWVTCPYALRRLQQDAARLGISIGEYTVPNVRDKGDTCAAQVPQDGGDLFLEEYRFSTEATNLTQVIQALARLMAWEKAEEDLAQQLVVVSNNLFEHLAQHATPVNAHIAIESETKMVKTGALWYEETLPPETLLYVAFSASKARKEKAEMAADAVLKGVTETLFGRDPYLQLGGNETLGMGWCKIKIIQGGN
jgi:CRISPR-associated protein Cmr4